MQVAMLNSHWLGKAYARGSVSSDKPHETKTPPVPYRSGSVVEKQCGKPKKVKGWDWEAIRISRMEFRQAK
jgi:hypothetical protein